MCPTWAPTSANVELLGTMFKGRHTAEAILAEFAFFQERDIEWAARCAMDKSQGPANIEKVNRSSRSPNIQPLFTFTPEDTQDLYEAGVKLLKRSQKDRPNQLPSNNTSVHRHIFCELINFETTNAGKVFQRLLDKHAFQSRIIKTLEELWKSKASDRRTARRLGTNLRFKGFLNLMEADDSQHGQGIEAHVDSDVAIGAVVVCLNWDGISLGLYEVDEHGQRVHVDIPTGTAVWVNGGCVHGVELSHRPVPRVTYNVFVYHAAAVDTATSDLSQKESKSKLDEVKVEHKEKLKDTRDSFKAALKEQGTRKSSRLE